jgi:hypothetical protein
MKVIWHQQSLQQLQGWHTRTSSSSLSFVSSQLHSCHAVISQLTRCESQTGIYKSLHKVGDCDAVHGKVGDNLRQVVHDVPHHNHHAKICHEKRRWADQGKDSA